MKKFVLLTIITVLTLLCFCSCEPSEEEQAIAVTEKYVTAVEQDDTATMYECYDPRLQKGAEGIANFGSNFLFGFGDAYDAALAMDGLFTSALKEAAGIENFEFNFIEVKECDLNKNKGTIISDYTLFAESDTKTLEMPITFNFEMIKIQDEWYIADEPAVDYDEEDFELSNKKGNDSENNVESSSKNDIVNSNNSSSNMSSLSNEEFVDIANSNKELIDFAIKECQYHIATQTTDIYNGTDTYLDSNDVTQTVPNIKTNFKAINMADIAGIKNINESFCTVVYNGVEYYPYWDLKNDTCLILDASGKEIESGINYDLDYTLKLSLNNAPNKNVSIEKLNTALNHSATYNVYVKTTNDNLVPYLYVWEDETELLGEWPGKVMRLRDDGWYEFGVNPDTYYNFIISNGNSDNQTLNLENYSSDVWVVLNVDLPNKGDNDVNIYTKKP